MVDGRGARHAAKATAQDFTCTLPARGTTSLHQHPSSAGMVQYGSRVARSTPSPPAARGTGGPARGWPARHGRRGMLHGTRGTHRRARSHPQILRFRMESNFAPVTKVARLYVIYSPIPFFLVFETTHMVDVTGYVSDPHRLPTRTPHAWTWLPCCTQACRTSACSKGIGTNSSRACCPQQGLCRRRCTD